MAKDTQQRLFGGNWTQEKLERLSKYLHAYTTIFKGNPRAIFFETTYVDAFAGTGTLAAPDLPLKFLPELHEGVEDYQKGSVRRALEVEPQFDHYIFVEKDRRRFSELQQITKEFSGRDIKVKNEDANAFLQNWCETLDTRKCRAVVFLDPFGANVRWATIRLIAMTGAIDLWLLFPLFAVNRMLIRDQKPPAAWANRLTDIFGTSEWEKEFYTTHKGTLPGLEQLERIEKVADTRKISNFFLQRLKQEFADVAEPHILYNSRNSPLYLLCFAAGNAKGATTGLRIAKYILEH